MLNFCTLFNIGYLTRGLALYQSLEEKCPAFHLYVFAFDDVALQFFRNHPSSFPNLTVISLQEFESEALLAVKASRSTAEYCWTCTPAVILYCIDTFKLAHCTYIDADMYFYADPTVLIEEMGQQSVLISEHRYTKAYDQSAYSGIYCVQFMCFKNTPEGMQVLTWWRDRCIEWCYARAEDGKFGDQKYLDDWTTRFSGIHVMQHKGGGVAPWNIQQYSLGTDGILTEKATGKKWPLVFFHYHGLTFYTNHAIALCGALYELEPAVKQQLYNPYINNLVRLHADVRKKGLHSNVTAAAQPSPSTITWYLKFLWQAAMQVKNGKLPLFKLIFPNFSLHYHIYKIKHGVPD